MRTHWAGRPFAKTPLEVSLPPPELSDPALDLDDIEPLGLAAEFGVELEVDGVACLSLPVQLAQKFHAVTDPRASNDRAHDLIDIVLLGDDVTRDRTTRQKAIAVFAERNTHPWPPTIAVRPGWDDLYRKHIADIPDFPHETAIECAVAAQAIIDRVNATAT